jgi:hypothetical protein
MEKFKHVDTIKTTGEAPKFNSMWNPNMKAPFLDGLDEEDHSYAASSIMSSPSSFQSASSSTSSRWRRSGFWRSPSKPQLLQCEVCGLRFKRKYDLRRHMPLHLFKDKGTNWMNKPQKPMCTTAPHSSCGSFDSFQSSYQQSHSAFSEDLYGSEMPPSPGRRGPLSGVARAAAKAVKDIKACWRCKILRKKVTTPSVDSGRQ